MKLNSRRQTAFLMAALGLALLGSGCFSGKKKTQPDLSASAQPDKILYDRATDDFKHSRYTVARLNLQTLINTYPDSEYLAKAKLAIADSYYKEGGTEGLLQSIAEYKDYITFFPFLDEASYAQMQVAMAHYRLMEKSDRDHAEALAAEQEFQTFLLKYPQSTMVPQAEQHLREVQEDLADGDFKTAQFYYIRGANRAAAARLIEVTSRYPLYSQADRANWMLGSIYDRSEKKDVAERYYARIVQDYPLSKYAPLAKQKLVAAGVPVPPADPDATKRMQDEQLYARNHRSMMQRLPVGVLRSAPDLKAAAHEGAPNLQPEGEPVSATKVLHPGVPEPTLDVAPTTESAAEAAGGAATGDTGGAESGGGGVGGTAGMSVETVPNNSSSDVPQSVESSSSPAPATPANPGTENAPAQNQTAGAETRSANGSAADGSVAPNSQTGNSAQQPAAQNKNASAGQKADKMDPKTESTSKKKKGWHKLIPW
jgi:outer membrane protein assembly factor BamD